MTVSHQLIDIATRNVSSLPADATIGEAAEIMARQGFSSIVVTDQDRHPVGIVTERNVLQAMRAGRPSGALLRDSMSAPVVMVPGTTPCLDAYQTCLREGIRHLVLADEQGRVAGVVSETDFRLHLNLTVLAGRRQIISVAQRSIASLPPHCSLMQALNLMQSRRESCVVVVEDEKPIGIVTERDVVRFYARDPERVAVPLAEVMTSPVLTIRSDASINQAAEEMLARKVRHLALVDAAGRMVGLASEHDLTQTMASGLQDEKFELDEMFLRTFIDTIPDLVWLKDVSGVFMACNPRFESCLGAKKADIVGKTDYDFWEKHLADAFRENDRAAMTEGRPMVNEEWVTFASDGHRELLETIKTPMYDRNGRLVGVLGVGRNITERERSKTALLQSEREFRTLAENVPDNLIRYDSEGRPRYMNPAMFSTVAPEVMPVVGEKLVETFPHSKEAAQIQQLVEKVIATGKSAKVEMEVPHPDGSMHSHHIIYVAEHDAKGNTVGALAIGRDITGLKRAEENLRIIASVFDNSQEAIVITDANNTILNVNPAFTRITGYAREEAVGQNPRMLNAGRQDAAFYAEMWKALKEKKAWRGEIWNRRKCGEIYAEMLSISAICDDAGKVQSYVGVFSDITYFKDHEAELSHVANYDALTGVPNRRLLADRLKQAIAHAQRGARTLAVCYLDLDGFKDVNDLYGHETGDQLLIGITGRLQEELRAGDTLARLGGDEFVILFTDLQEAGECHQALGRIMNAIALPMKIGTYEVAVSASIGVTFYPSDEQDGDTLLRHADQAMYVAKQQGKSRYHIYDAEHDQRIREQHEFRRRILQGLDAGEFELYYQPKLELASKRVTGVEALVRWHHPERGLLNPADFLSALENSELEIRLGNWVLDTALVQLHDWERAGVVLEVSINVSARHLLSPDFLGELQRQLARYPRMPHGRLQIEVLETTALEDMARSFEVIKACRELGISVALDDFGTGYSSLVYLSKLGADTLKIDQSFVQDMVDNQGDRAIVEGVIALAKTFNRQTVAEGMEDPSLVATLADMGCGYVQGYGVAQPMPASEFLEWYRRH